MNPTGTLLASVSDDTNVIVWQYHPDSKDVRADGRWVGCAQTFPLVVVADIGFPCSPPSPMQWKRAATLSGFHERTIFSVDWSRTGDFIVTGAADDAIRVFRQTQPTPAPAFDLVAKLDKAHSSDINCVRWSPAAPADNDGALLLASAGDDGLVRVWRFVPPQA